MRGTAILTVLLLLSTAAVAAAAPSSDHALYFRLLVGPEPGKPIGGYLDESGGTGKGFDVAVLDLDGDRRLETRVPLRLQVPANLEGEDLARFTEHELDLTVDGRLYTVSLRGLPRAGQRKVIPFGLDWIAQTPDGSMVMFISGVAFLARSPIVAAFLPPIRLGPPFRCDATAVTRGPKGFVETSVRCANGAGLTLVVRHEGGVPEEVPVVVELWRGGERALSATAEYG